MSIKIYQYDYLYVKKWLDNFAYNVLRYAGMSLHDPKNSDEANLVIDKLKKTLSKVFSQILSDDIEQYNPSVKRDSFTDDDIASAVNTLTNSLELLMSLYQRNTVGSKVESINEMIQEFKSDLYNIKRNRDKKAKSFVLFLCESEVNGEFDERVFYLIDQHSDEAWQIPEFYIERLGFPTISPLLCHTANSELRKSDLLRVKEEDLPDGVIEESKLQHPKSYYIEEPISDNVDEDLGDIIYRYTPLFVIEDGLLLALPEFDNVELENTEYLYIGGTSALIDACRWDVKSFLESSYGSPYFAEDVEFRNWFGKSAPIVASGIITKGIIDNGFPNLNEKTPLPIAQQFMYTKHHIDLICYTSSTLTSNICRSIDMVNEVDVGIGRHLLSSLSVEDFSSFSKGKNPYFRGVGQETFLDVLYTHKNIYLTPFDDLLNNIKNSTSNSAFSYKMGLMTSEHEGDTQHFRIPVGLISNEEVLKNQVVEYMSKATLFELIALRYDCYTEGFDRNGNYVVGSCIPNTFTYMVESHQIGDSDFVKKDYENALERVINKVSEHIEYPINSALIRCESLPFSRDLPYDVRSTSIMRESIGLSEAEAEVGKVIQQYIDTNSQNIDLEVIREELIKLIDDFDFSDLTDDFYFECDTSDWIRETNSTKLFDVSQVIHRHKLQSLHCEQ